MERLAILLALFVVLVVLILARRQAGRERTEAPAPVAMPAAVAAAALADAPGVRGPQGAGARDPYARLGSCPSCDRPMVERIGKRGALKGKPYLVCSGDPPCATVPADG